MWRKVALLACLALSTRAQEAISITTSEAWTAELKGVWRWHAGDDMQWASPDFDDSNWPHLALPGPRLPLGRYWIRIPVRLESTSDPGLMLGPIAFAYEAYFDGKKVGNFGKLPPEGEWFIPRWHVFRVPPGLASTGDHTIAIRLWVNNGGWGTRNPRYTVTDNRVGNYGALREAQASLMSADFHVRFLELVVSSVIVLAGLYFLLLPPSISQGTAFRWFGAAIFLKGLQSTSGFYAEYARLDPSGAALRSISHIGIILCFVTFIDFAYALFSSRVALLIRGFQGLMIVFLVIRIVFERGSPIPSFTSVQFWVIFIASLIPVALAIVRFRAGFPGSGLTLALFSVVALVMLENLLSTIYLFPLAISFHIGPFLVSHLNAALVLWIPAMAMQIQKTNLRFRDERERLRGEVEAARHVQEILLPSRSIQAPGFRVDAVYHPATEVGGDFFQFFPAPSDSLLVVVGDVSGKGMKAALLVSVIVGALQNRKSNQPRVVLSELNAVLLGRNEGGFTTCCCALFARDAGVMLANAGHIAPYRNGKEIQTKPGLPLGVTPEASWEETRVDLQPSDRILWISDGVVEARNGKHELLGFERAEELATRTAAEISQAAQQFGQDDDITVVSITRQAVAAYGA